MSEQQKLKQKERLIDLLYQTLKEIEDVNDAVMFAKDGKFKDVGASYLNGFINAKVSSVEEFIRGCYQEDSNDRKEEK